MPDWTKSMQQSFEYYIVDPSTWKDVKKIENVKSSSIRRESTAETLGSASINVVDLLGECYVRTYLITIQNGVREKHPLGTHLIQTPTSRFDGKNREVTMDAYTPLLELKENPTPLGYSILQGENIMDHAYRIVREIVRPPIVKTECDTELYSDFVANNGDTWLTFLTDLIANARYTFDLDEMGRILFSPRQDLDSMQPVWTYTDDNSSILYPAVSLDHDLYGVPNIVEVIYSKDGDYYYSKVVNDDPNSPTSTINRGREILHRENNPDMLGEPTQAQIDEYATQLLQELSTVEYSITYEHGFCPVRVGDCVRINYTRAGLTNIKAKVVSQTIKCESGCSVSEKAIFTSKLWR